MDTVDAIYNVDGVQHTGRFETLPDEDPYVVDYIQIYLKVRNALLTWNDFENKWEVRYIYDRRLAASLNASHYYKERP